MVDAQKEMRQEEAPAKRVLPLPDLEHAKTAVLNSLTSASGQRTYEHAIEEFVAWYCSEPEAADAGLLSPELAAGIRRVKGVRRLGVRLGNWLTVEQGRRLVTVDRESLRR